MDQADVRTPRRPSFWMRLSIASGNLVQIAGIVAGSSVMYAAVHLELSGVLKVLLTILGWLVIYLCCHSLAHWFVGRLAGIRFRYYGVRGTDHPEALSPAMRAILSRLPMFTALTEKESMEKASPVAKALMYAAGESASILCTLLAGLYAWKSHIPGGIVVLAAATLMSLTGVVSTIRIPRGDFAKALHAMRER